MKIFNIGKENKIRFNKKRAAYALNLCMVSVSQIVDYDDVYVLEQEYDTILNNLNLEYMPKDEALLEILRQLLNTITFFKIQEMEKDFIEKEYQHKMKNAIWSAVPNIGMIASGGIGWGTVVALASQVGIGYMNYRREKSEISLQQDREKLKMLETALEQFNGLRRELFTTAWRLADKYKFKDQLRITEKQITRYNKILMDDNYSRRYERLKEISSDFEAYPPFWCFFGNAANMAANEFGEGEIDTAKHYRKLACEHYEKFLKETEYNLLREDQLRASCALEYFDLLVKENPDNKSFLLKLLSIALAAAPSSLDVKEICAMYYLRLDEKEKAMELLRVLVNENYNTEVNAQFLSSLYVSKYIENKDELDRDNVEKLYNSLLARVNKNVLIPLPNEDNENKSFDNFIEMQRDLLIAKYNKIADDLKKDIPIKIRYLLPLVNDNMSMLYFIEEKNGYENYRREIEGIFSNESAKNNYLKKLSKMEIGKQFIDALDDFRKLVVISWPYGKEEIDKKLITYIDEVVGREAPDLGNILNSINNGTTSKGDMMKLLSLLNSIYSVLLEILETEKRKSSELIKTLGDMAEISSAEWDLRTYCKNNSLAYPEKSLLNFESEEKNSSLEWSFKEILNITEYLEEQKKRADKYDKIREIISSYKDLILLSDAKKIELITDNDKIEFGYLRRKGRGEDYKGEKDKDTKILAILNDTSWNNDDLLFCADGLYYNKSKKNFVDYAKVKPAKKDKTLTIGNKKYSCKRINIDELYKMIQKLSECQ